MINVTREPNTPASLATNEIRNYVQECADYKDDPTSNPKPSKPTSYRTSDLLEAFDRCFHSKCYLTEEKFFNSWKMDVEHFVPQNQDPGLVYEWTNLYPAEHKANMSKPRTNPNGGYLDPCDAADDVETEIIYSPATARTFRVVKLLPASADLPIGRQVCDPYFTKIYIATPAWVMCSYDQLSRKPFALEPFKLLK